MSTRHLAWMERVPEPLVPQVVVQAAGVGLEWLQEVMARSADLEELAALCQLWERLVAVCPADDPVRCELLLYLAMSQYLRARVTGREDDLEQAIGTCRSLLEATPADDLLATVRGNLAAMLLTRFGATGELGDLDEAIALSRLVADAIPADDPQLPGVYSNLCNALRTRFLRNGDLADLDSAIDYGRAAVRTAPGNLDPVTNLGSALRVRFARRGARADIDEAVVLAEDAAAAPAGHPSLTAFQSNLGTVLLTRYQALGDLPDLVRAIEVYRAVLAAGPADNPDQRALVLSQLGSALRHRFERLGDLADLDEGIEVLLTALTATSRRSPARGQRALNLSSTFRLRYKYTGSGADLQQALEWVRHSLDATEADHPDRAHVLHLLAVVLDDRFGRTGVPADLDEAVEASRQAVAATPDDHSLRAEHLTVLGDNLQRRAAVTGSRADLEEAIEIGRLAVRAAVRGTPVWASCLSNHALGLRARFDLTESPDDLRAVIAAQREVLEATPSDDPSAAERLLNLGHSLVKADTAASAHEATEVFLEAAYQPSIAPSIRIDAAAAAATMLLRTDLARAAQLLELAVRLLPERASYRLAREDQQHVLGGVAGLTSHAASLALIDDTRVGEPPALRAVRLLELGRGVMLSQALDSRSDLTELRAHHPRYADQFLALRNSLDGGVAGADRHRASVELSTLLTRIRGLDGFGSFLLPPDPAELLRHAEAGPIVVLNVSKYGSDALLVTTAGVTRLPLPELTLEVSRDRIEAFVQALQEAHDPEAEPRRRIGAQDTLDEVLGWLWDAAVHPILDQLGHRSTPAEGEPWPRVWWIPVGLMGLLPLHAAGHHRSAADADGRPTAMDRVISSYTPTIRALGFARERDSAVAATDPALIVAMPTTPDLDKPLHHAAREADLVHARLPGSALLIESPDSVAVPSKAAVLAKLADCAIAHFACHGSDQPDDPSRSMLLLRDHGTDPLTVGDIVPIRLTKARLAYLSACRTALSTATQLVDEAIHLTTAFLLAGYPHVVGTLWEIDDALAATIADDFYAALITADTFDTSVTAHALHRAVRSARDRLPRTPSLWAGYVHTGA